jgi:uncharacterized protein involved in exopolysaccharide biosynthesis
MTSSTSFRADLASNDQVTLRDFLQFLTRNKWIAFASAVAFAIATAIVAEIIPPEYIASVTLLPVTRQSGSLGLNSISSTLSQFSGVASLAGIKLGSTSGLEADALATLQSRLLTNMYIKQHNLMPLLFADQWNDATNTWKESDPKKIPTLWDADQLFKKHIRKVVRNAKTGTITLTVEWKNPQLAAQWANGLVTLTNNYLRQQTLTESNREIAYLRHEILRTDLVGVKTAIYSLMEQEIKEAMIAKGRVDFALRVVDPAMPPQKKSFPKPLLWTIGGGFFGLILGYFSSLIRDTVRSDDSRDDQRQLPSKRAQESSELP